MTTTQGKNVTTSFLVNKRIASAMQEALYGAQGLALLKHVLNDEPGQAFLHLLRLLAGAEQVPMQVASAYSEVFYALAASEHVYITTELSDAWQAHMVGRLLEDENPWTAQVERQGRAWLGSQARISATLHRQAARELKALQRLFALSAEVVWEAVQSVVGETMPVLRDAWEPWLDLGTVQEPGHKSVRAALIHQIAELADWSELADMLEMHWARQGTGALARYAVLRWQGNTQTLEGIAHPDAIHLDNFVGYERELRKLKANTERFLAGMPAHDALLYGPPGTGKSSSVKALINTYADQGLRLVEVRREFIGDLPQIVAQLRQRAPSYLVFIDDLSFEEHETEYKVLKMLLEGTAEARPQNVLIYATTNRLNLVRELHTDRSKPTEEVNWRDTMDEKQSLVHRFGLRITFSAPSQEQYLQIAQGLAQQRGLALEEEELRSRALQWERQRVGRSGRLARQFVDELEAEIGR